MYISFFTCHSVSSLSIVSIFEAYFSTSYANIFCVSFCTIFIVPCLLSAGRSDLSCNPFLTCTLSLELLHQLQRPPVSTHQQHDIFFLKCGHFYRCFNEFSPNGECSVKAYSAGTFFPISF